MATIKRKKQTGSAPTVGAPKHNIQEILTKYMTLLSVLLLLLLTVVFSVMQYTQLNRSTLDNLRTSSKAVGETIDEQFNQMNNMSLNAVSSSTLRQSFIAYQNDTLSEEDRINIRQLLSGEMTTIRSYDTSVRQLNFYSMDASGFGVGSYYGDLPDNASDHTWYRSTIAQHGQLYIADPATDSVLSTYEDVTYLSATRLVYNNASTPIGIVEVKKFYNDIFNAAVQADGGIGTSIIIYDKTGRQLYPLSGNGATYSYFEGSINGNGMIRNTETGKKEYVLYHETKHNDLLVVTAVEQNQLYTPILNSLKWIWLLLIIMLGISVLFSNYLAGIISSPIRHIYHFLSREGRADFAEIQMADTGIHEIDKLRDLLNEDTRSKAAAATTMMTLKEQEVQAQMLALQSQMNPHFLYNSLSTIAEMAEEGEVHNVSQMCTDITEILRYISSNKEQTTSIEEEMELCMTYLRCMKVRFGDALHYTFDIDDDMLDFQIPKLCIQLLVENAIKSTSTQSPPWNIKIHGYQKDNTWYMTVEDDGPGFDPEVDRHLRSQMDEILEKGLLPSLQINGMGILNIFIRLYLKDGIPFVFDFGNLPEGGAFVTVGGYIHDKK